MTMPGQRSHSTDRFAARILAVLLASLFGCSSVKPTATDPGTQISEVPAVIEPLVDSGPPASSNDAGTSDDAALIDDAAPVGDKGINDAGIGDGAQPGATDPPDVSASDAAKLACAQAAKGWIEIAQANCVACHGRRSPGRAGFTTILEVDELLASGKVVAGKPEQSPLFVKLSTGVMPPAERTQRPSASDIEVVRNWISCGAPKSEQPPCERDCTTFVDVATRVSSLVQDVEKFATAEERGDLRYIDLSNVANAGHGEARLELYRDAISFLVNSLSTAPTIVAPLAVDSQNLLFRIRLSDYGWSASTWERIVANYPYGVSYDPSSRTFPTEEANSERLRSQTGTATPYIQADWFFSQAVRPPLYYDILGIPAQLSELATAFGIDLQANIDEQRVVRAGFNDSGASHFNRVIERHTISDQRAFWLTYDFNAGAGLSNVLTHPLDFQHSSSEILFNLPNGLQAYLIVDARGARLDKAPNDAVQDPLSNDFAIEAGISCLSCHTNDGLIPRADEVRATATLTTSNLSDLDKILAVYVEESKLNTVFDEAQTRYRQALLATRERQFDDASAHELDDTFRGFLSLRDVAGVLGVEEPKLATTIGRAPLVFPPEIAALRTPGATIRRANFDAVFDALVVALGLGQPR